MREFSPYDMVKCNHGEMHAYQEASQQLNGGMEVYKMQFPVGIPSCSNSDNEQVASATMKLQP